MVLCSGDPAAFKGGRVVLNPLGVVVVVVTGVVVLVGVVVVVGGTFKS